MFSPSSIANFLDCQHLTALDRAAVTGKMKRPFFADPGRDLLIKLGQAHEQDYLRKLVEEGRKIAEIPNEGDGQGAAARTIAAIRGGADVIYQPTFLDDQWYGRADFLIRVDTPSELGAFSYEVVETKLARSTKARAIIQLCFYSDLLSRIQSVAPYYMHVVLGGGANPERFFVQQYLAFFRKVKRDFVAAQASQNETYPEPIKHCRICDWEPICDAQWRKDDHLSLVANITRNQRQALITHGTKTMAALADMPAAPHPSVEGIKAQAVANLHQQARLQVQGREERRNVYELLAPAVAEKGLCSLPAPSPGDVFLDFEGETLTFESGLEYLFGVVTITSEIPSPGGSSEATEYQANWALNPDDEKREFEKFIGTVIERRRQYPDMHVYHFGAYEETAIKRMSNQHSICLDEVDDLLRGEVFVDLLRAVRQGLRASVESYSIKKLEPFYDYKRDVNLPDANRALATLQTILAFGPGDEDFQQLKAVIEGYNRDDCLSALHLRDWLEQLRKELEERTGEKLPRPAPKQETPSENLSEYLKRAHAVEERLTTALPEEKDTWTESQKATALLANLIEWHRREDKSKYWEYYNRCDFSDEEFITDRATLGGLVYEREVGPFKKSIVHRYSFPLQDSTIERALTLRDPKTKDRTGDLHEISLEALTIDLKRGPSLIDAPHPSALVPHDFIPPEKPRESLLQIGNSVADHAIDGSGPYTAARQLLLRHVPRLQQAELSDFKSLPSLEAAKQIGLLLNGTVLPIQGPPGSGKTHTGAHMILELVRNRKRVGVAAVSHKVISNLLKEICKAAAKAEENVKIVQRCDGGDGYNHSFVKIAQSNPAVNDALAKNEVQVVAGTVYLWSRPELANSVDVL
jgi:uncharacterized protein